MTPFYLIVRLGLTVVILYIFAAFSYGWVRSKEDDYISREERLFFDMGIPILVLGGIFALACLWTLKLAFLGET